MNAFAHTTAFRLTIALFGICLGLGQSEADSPDLKTQLASLPDKIVFESYDHDNWELFMMDADGSNRRNLTNTKDVHELYPQASPDGSKICFLVDTPEGRNTTRTLFYMSLADDERVKVTDGARHPTWSPDGTKIAFAKQEFGRFDVKDYVSKYLFIFDLETGDITRHGNDKIEHIYVPSWSPDGEWIFTTVHGGMGYGHAILAVEANGSRVLDMTIPGCRPCVSADAKHLTWSADDHTISVADIEMTSEGPRLQNTRTLHKEQKLHLYHPDFSPDSKYISFSMGPGGRCIASRPGTHTQVAEMVGVCGPWDIYVKAVDGDEQLVRITHDSSLSNKESEWIRVSN